MSHIYSEIYILKIIVRFTINIKKESIIFLYSKKVPKFFLIKSVKKRNRAKKKKPQNVKKQKEKKKKKTAQFRLYLNKKGGGGEFKKWGYE